MTALALTCISADSKKSLHVCLFPSALNSPLTPFKSWFVWVTSANLRRRLGKTSCKAASFKSAYFHLISHQYEMGSYERAQFTVHWVAFFKKNTLIDALPDLPSNVWRVAGPHNCMLACPLSQSLYEKTISIKQMYIFMHGECLFFNQGASVPHADSKLWFSHGVEMRQLFVCVKGWRKRGFFMVWVHCESSFTSCSTLLQVN